jgi:hypothetical protein
MKFTLILTSILGGAIAFHVPAPFAHKQQRLSPLKSSDTIVDTTATTIDVTTTVAKAELLETAQDLNDKYGCLIIDSAAQDKLRDVVEQLEDSVSEFPADPSGLVGDWTLLCSTASSTMGKIGGIDTSRIPFFNEGPLKEIRDRINKSLTVQQIIKKAEKGDGIDRIDHVLQYQPPATLSDFLQNLPDAIKSLNINPLQVSESKVILVHNAELESVIPLIKTKLSLSSLIGKQSIIGGNNVMMKIEMNLVLVCIVVMNQPLTDMHFSDLLDRYRRGQSISLESRRFWTPRVRIFWVSMYLLASSSMQDTSILPTWMTRFVSVVARLGFWTNFVSLSDPPKLLRRRKPTKRMKKTFSWMWSFQKRKIQRKRKKVTTWMPHRMWRVIPCKINEALSCHV